MWSGKNVLRALAVLMLGISAYFWFGLQSILTANRASAIGMTAILTLATPSLASFLLPWSPAAQLLQKMTWKSWGYFVLTISGGWLLYYEWDLLTTWWSQQPNTVQAGLAMKQAITSIIGFVVVPTLVWSAVDTNELLGLFHQNMVVKKFEIETAAIVEGIRIKRMRANYLGAIGWANLLPAERTEFLNLGEEFRVGFEQDMRALNEGVGRMLGSEEEYGGVLVSPQYESPTIPALQRIYQTLSLEDSRDVHMSPPERSSYTGDTTPMAVRRRRGQV
jgi:hypothetical protein